MTGKYVIIVKTSVAPFISVNPRECVDGGSLWEAVEYAFSEDWLAPDVNIVASGEFGPVLLEVFAKYGHVYRYGDWTSPWWLAWRQTSAFDDNERKAAEYAYSQFINGLTEVKYA